MRNVAEKMVWQYLYRLLREYLPEVPVRVSARDTLTTATIFT